MFDTHAHVHVAAFDADRGEMLARARLAGVERIVTVGTDVADSRNAQAVAARYGLDYAIGIHPHEAKDAPADVAAALDEIRSASPLQPVAIGEMGLDYYYEHSPPDAQRTVLSAQLQYARSRGLPAIFHQRDAFEDFVAMLRAEPAPPRGVVHCFTGDARQARLLVDEFGLRLGIGGVVTFKNATALREAVLEVGLDHVLLETDCPYLAPVPHRGRRNEPAYAAATAEALAALFGVGADEVDRRTSANGAALFRA
jgi:TatD DNase family protein